MDMPVAPRSNKKRPLALVAIVALVVLLVVIDMRRRAAETQLQALSVRLEQLSGGNQTQNQEAAKRIVSKVRALYDIPADIEPTVATIVDVAALRQRNPFYNKAENGDYLVVTPERAILYRDTKNMIIDVVPVQIQPETAASSSSSVAAKKAPAVAPTPTPTPTEPTPEDTTPPADQPQQ